MQQQMKLVLLGIGATLLAPATSVAQTPESPNHSAEAVRVWKSHEIDFVSEVTGRPYRLLVSLPESPPPTEGYPVVYVIDGGLYFGTATETARLQGLNFFTPPIVVAVGYQQEGTVPALGLRMKDLTLPLDAQEVAAMPAAMRGNLAPEDTGGLDAYLTMLRTEIRDLVAAQWPTDRSRQIVFGHSLGGLAVLRQFMRDPGAYAGYIASAPSIWFKDRAVLADEGGLPERLRALDKAPTVVLLVGGDEEEPPRIAPDNPDLPPGAVSLRGVPVEELRHGLRATAMVKNVEQLGQRLSQMDNLRTTTVVFPDEDHASVVPAAISRGLRLTLTR